MCGVEGSSCVSREKNKITEWANSVNNGAKGMEFSSHDGADTGEYNGAGFVDI